MRMAFGGRGISLQSMGDAERVRIGHPDKMRHDIADFPEGTGAGRGPGVLWQGGEVLLQPLGLGLDDCDKFCLCGHGSSLLFMSSLSTPRFWVYLGARRPMPGRATIHTPPGTQRCTLSMANHTGL